TDSVLDSTKIVSGPVPFGVGEFDGQISGDAAGSLFSRAAAHPYSLETDVEFNATNSEKKFLSGIGIPGAGDLWPVEPIKDVVVDLPTGLLGNPSGVGQCRASELGNSSGTIALSLCPANSQVGTTLVRMNNESSLNVVGPVPVYNVVPPPGSPARFGF